MTGNRVLSCGVNGLQVYNDTNKNNQNIFIVENYVKDTTAVPIEIQRSYRAVVMGNIVEGSGTNGISVGSAQYQTIQNNIVEDQSQWGIELSDIDEGGNSVVNGNVIYNCGTGILTSEFGGNYGSKMVISNNIIDTTTAQEGIDCQYVSELVITGNEITDPKTFGIRVHGETDGIEVLTDVLINNNIIKFESARTADPTGISLHGIDGGKVSNNLIRTDVVYTNEYGGLILVQKGNKDLHITDNELVASTLLDFAGVYGLYANSGSSIYISRNFIKNFKAFFPNDNYFSRCQI